jgi:hypothetical protein
VDGLAPPLATALKAPSREVLTQALLKLLVITPDEGNPYNWVQRIITEHGGQGFSGENPCCHDEEEGRPPARDRGCRARTAPPGR